MIANKGDLLGEELPVHGGSADTVPLALGSGLSMLMRNGQASGLRIELQLPEYAEAPVAAGDVLGTVNVLLDGQIIARLNCVAATAIPKPGFIEGFERIVTNWR